MHRLAILVLCTSMLSWGLTGMVSATEYPWEKDAKEEKQKSAQPIAPSKKQHKSLHFGPFLVDPAGEWKYVNDPDQGEALMFFTDKGLDTVIAFRDTLKTSNRQALERGIIRDFKHQEEKRISLAGNSDVLALLDIADDQTQVFLFPYTGDTVYVIVVAYREKRQNLSGETNRILRSFRFFE